MSTTQSMFSCPYNRAHSIYKERIQFHLARCRMQHPDAERTTCPFNATHIVPKVELTLHLIMCPNRSILDSLLVKVSSDDPPDRHPPPPEPVLAHVGDEDWDESLSVSVLDQVKEESTLKPALVPLIGAPKSERRAHRQQQRLRMQQLQQLPVSTSVSTFSGAQATKKPSDTVCNASNNIGEQDERMVRHENEQRPRSQELQSLPSTSASVTFEDFAAGDFAGAQVNTQMDGTKQDRKPSSRDPRNPWGQPSAQPPVSMSAELSRPSAEGGSGRSGAPARGTAGSATWGGGRGTGGDQMSAALERMSLRERRDPEDPWRTTTRRANQPNTAISPVDDFPVLPVSGRGRGKPAPR